MNIVPESYLCITAHFVVLRSSVYVCCHAKRHQHQPQLVYAEAMIYI